MGNDQTSHKVTKMVRFPPMDEETIISKILDAAVRLHMDLGPGLLESVYEMALAKRLERDSLTVQRQVAVTFEYDGIRFEDAFRVDLLVEDRIVVELKSVECLQPVHFKQVTTYIRLLDKPYGLLLNFGAAKMRDGIRRIINNKDALASRRITPGA